VRAGGQSYEEGPKASAATNFTWALE